MFIIPISFLIHEEKRKVSRIHAFSQVVIELVRPSPLDTCNKLALSGKWREAPAFP